MFVATLIALAATATLHTAPADDPGAAATPGGIAYLLTIRDHLTPEHATASDDALMAVAQSVCQGFDAGLTAPTMIGIAMGQGYSPYEAGALLAGATTALCPQYDGTLNSQLNGN